MNPLMRLLHLMLLHPKEPLYLAEAVWSQAGTVISLFQFLRVVNECGVEHIENQRFFLEELMVML
jgi:hypothetical protein